jgi:hypothetical protein
MKRRYLTLIVCLPLVAWCQSESVTKVIRVQSAPSEIARIVQAQGCHVEASNALSAVIIQGRPDCVASSEKIVRELDQQGSANDGRNIELTAYIISGTSSSSSEERIDSSLEPALKQLRSLFPSKHYELLGTLYVRSAQNSGASAAGSIALPSIFSDANSSSSRCWIAYDSASALSPESAIHIRKLLFVTSVPVFFTTKNEKGEVKTTGSTANEVKVQSDVDLREGQKVVIGKSNIGKADDSIFLVLSARLVQ